MLKIQGGNARIPNPIEYMKVLQPISKARCVIKRWKDRARSLFTNADLISWISSLFTTLELEKKPTEMIWKCRFLSSHPPQHFFCEFTPLVV